MSSLTILFSILFAIVFTITFTVNGIIQDEQDHERESVSTTSSAMEICIQIRRTFLNVSSLMT
jgi:hypothetical protein